MHKCTHVLHSLRILLEPTISNVLNNWFKKLRLNLKTLNHVEQAKYQFPFDKTLHQLKHTMLYLTIWNNYVLMKKYPCSSSSCEQTLTIHPSFVPINLKGGHIKKTFFLWCWCWWRKNTKLREIYWKALDIQVWFEFNVDYSRENCDHSLIISHFNNNTVNLI